MLKVEYFKKGTKVYCFEPNGDLARKYVMDVDITPFPELIIVYRLGDTPEQKLGGENINSKFIFDSLDKASEYVNNNIKALKDEEEKETVS